MMRIYKIIILFIALLPVFVNAGKLDFTTIKKYAELSEYAYMPYEKVKNYLAERGFNLIRYNEINELRVSYFLVEDKKNKTQIIAVRGTDNIENIVVDLKLHLEKDPFLSIYLHRGFSDSARAVYKDVKSLLRKDYRHVITGHSLGGAVALILSLYLKKEGFIIDDVVTFGQPKVTNFYGVDAFKDIRVLRVVTEKDLVPIVPPFDPVDIKNIDIFWHTGVELILLNGNRYSITSGIKSMFRATKLFKKIPDKKNLKYHKIGFYIDLINKKLNGSEKIPYKSDFSIIDLF